MNRHYLILSLVALVIPACMLTRRKKPPVITCPEVCQPVCPAPVLDTPAPQEQATLDENLGAFVLDEEANPLTGPAAATPTENAYEEELTMTNAEEPISDTHAHSAQHGLKTIFYDFDHYDIRPDQEPVLEHNLETVKRLARDGHEIVVEGHACDSAGSPAYNMMLSEERAKGVAQYFEKHGIDKQALKTVGRGSEMRRVPFGNREQQAPNRRVEIYAYPMRHNA